MNEREGGGERGSHLQEAWAYLCLEFIKGRSGQHQFMYRIDNDWAYMFKVTQDRQTYDNVKILQKNPLMNHDRCQVSCRIAILGSNIK